MEPIYTNEVLMHLLRRASAMTRRSPHRCKNQPPSAADGFYPPPPPRKGRYKGYGLILTILTKEEGISQSKLAAMLNIRPQSLSEVLGKMEQQELVKRHRNESDKRRTLVFLTEKGRSRAAELETERKIFADSFFAPLTAEERVSLPYLLTKLIGTGRDQ